MTQLSTAADDDPDWQMKNAFRALRDKHYASDAEKEHLLAELLAGSNPAWAWFALKDLELTDDARQALCRIVVRGGDGLIMLWVLTGVSGLSANDRNALKASLIRVKLSDLAQIALERITDLTETEQLRLSRVAIGLDPDQDS